MIPRAVTNPIEQALKRQAAVAIIGPRQVGKTTLAREIADSHPGALYLDLEAREDREKLIEPVLFLRQYENSLVVLDEIHRVPELFSSLRGIIDQGRRTGHATGRFLILGSASIDLLRQSGESLAGRITYIDMGPFFTLELPANEPTLLQLWLRGGFPGSYLAEDDSTSLRWRTDFIRTYLERDVPQFGPRIPAGVLERLWTMLAHGQGTLLNASRLAAALQISASTAQRYIDLLTDLLLVRRLPPFHRNVGKRLVKSPESICAGQWPGSRIAWDQNVQRPCRPSSSRRLMGGLCNRKPDSGGAGAHGGQLLSHFGRCGDRFVAGDTWSRSMGHRDQAQPCRTAGEGVLHRLPGFEAGSPLPGECRQRALSNRRGDHSDRTP